MRMILLTGEGIVKAYMHSNCQAVRYVSDSMGTSQKDMRNVLMFPLGQSFDSPTPLLMLL